jgi:hypothetical protein
MKEPRNLGLPTPTHTSHTRHTQPREIGRDSSGTRPGTYENERAAPPRMYKIAHLSDKNPISYIFRYMQPTIFREVAFLFAGH